MPTNAPPMHRRRFLGQAARVAALAGVLATPTAALLAQRAPVARAAGSRVAYVALGDSLTFGFGADDPIRDSYPTLLARHLSPGALFLNLGRDNNTALEASGTDLDSAVAARPTLLTVQLGGNDLGMGVPPEKVEATMRDLLTALHGTRAALFVLNYPDVLAAPGHQGDLAFARTIADFNRFLASEAARRHAVVIDIYAASKQLYGDPRNVSTGFHLTARGYASLAALCYGVMHRHHAI